MKRVVITGMGVVSPVGNALGDFWKNLTDGVCGVGPITRFDTADYKVKVAAEVKNFNAADYGMDVPTQRRMDLFAQYAVAAAQQAALDSGIDGTLPPERLGVYVGSGIGGMNTFVEQTNRLRDRGPSRVSALFIPMMISNMAAGTIAMRHDAQGPCLPTVTACATSTHAVGEAYHAIAHGYADAIYAGGSEAAITPLAIAGFTSCMALTQETDPLLASLPFDARRAGFVMGEGAGILVLEEYEHALSRGAHIYAEVCGYGNTCDAYHVTAPRPDGSGGARAMKIALEEANYRPGADSLYINAQVHDRPHAGRGGRGGADRLRHGAGERHPAAHHWPDLPRPRLRPGLCALRCPSGAGRCGSVHVAGLWRPQRRGGAAEGVSHEDQ